MIEALADVTSHLDMLDLVTADRHAMRVEDENVGSHQHRIHEKACADAGIAIFVFRGVAIDRRLVGMRAIEQTL